IRDLIVTGVQTCALPISALERSVGKRLLERSRGPGAVRLTEAGELLLGHAQAIRARLHAAQADLGALDAGELGALHVGITQSVRSEERRVGKECRAGGRA